MNDLLREIDEELRYDRLRERWNQYGKKVTVVVGIGLLSVAGYQGWGYWHKQQQSAVVAQWAQAKAEASQDNYANANALLSEVKAKSSLNGLLRLQQAAWADSEGNDEDKIKFYSIVSSESEAEPSMRAMASLMQAAEAVTPADPGTVTHEGAFAPFMVEQQALHAIEAERIAEAATMLHALSNDASAPQAMRSRALEMFAYLQHRYPDVVVDLPAEEAESVLPVQEPMVVDDKGEAS